MAERHHPEPLTDTTGRIVSMHCRICGRPINVFKERPFTEEERLAANAWGTVQTFRHNPGPGYPHPRRAHA